MLEQHRKRHYTNESDDKNKEAQDSRQIKTPVTDDLENLNSDSDIDKLVNFKLLEKNHSKRFNTTITRYKVKLKDGVSDRL